MERQQHTDLKGKMRDELREFAIITLFFTLVFGVFNLYRRLVLGEAGISYTHYGITLVEALILAKCVLIGEAFNLGLTDASRRSIFEVAVLRSFLFVALVCLFTIIERIVEGLILGRDWVGIVHSIVAHGQYEILARLIMMLSAFFPFFAFWELRRRLGRRRFFILMFSRGDSISSEDNLQ